MYAYVHICMYVYICTYSRMCIYMYVTIYTTSNISRSKPPESIGVLHHIVPPFSSSYFFKDLYLKVFTLLSAFFPSKCTWEKGRKTQGLTCRRSSDPLVWFALHFCFFSTYVSCLYLCLPSNWLYFLPVFSSFCTCIFSVNLSFFGICLSSLCLSAFSICPSLCRENALKCHTYTYTYTYMYTQTNCHVMNVCSSGSIWGNGREKRDCTLRKSWLENTLKIYLYFAIATLSNRFVCYNVLQCVLVCRRVLQRVVVSWSASASLLQHPWLQHCPTSTSHSDESCHAQIHDSLSVRMSHTLHTHSIIRL